uniref:Major facilitator superfamily (MFS) profile domain-containing protein n=1 Tax=Panagrolaimus sp. ES5 TaxID=591445 RepID=A0AC34G384_9BILA
MRAYDDTLNWSANQITLILSATFYGGLLTMFWSGYLADRFTPKIVIVCAILDCVIVSGFTPFLAYKNFYALFFARVAMGLGEDFLGPAQASFITRCGWVITWGLYSSDTPALHRHITKDERNYIETELQELGINQEPKSKKLYEALFGSGWVITWGLYSSDTPALHRHITKDERNYIETELQELGINQEPKSKKVNIYLR